MPGPVVPDRSAAQLLYEEYRAAAGDGAGAPTAVEAFGDGPEMADELLALVLDGTKRATAALVSEFRAAGDPLPEPGDCWVVVDGRGAPACVLRTVQVRVGPLESVDEAFARDEGEGERTREWWLEAHRGYWRRQGERSGVPYDERAEPVVFERFAVVWPPAARDASDEGRSGR